jgi:hypothetical protein
VCRNSTEVGAGTPYIGWTGGVVLMFWHKWKHSTEIEWMGDGYVWRCKCGAGRSLYEPAEWMTCDDEAKDHLELVTEKPLNY